MDYSLKLVVEGDASGATSALQSATGALNSFGSKAAMAGGILTAGLTLPIVGIGKAALDASSKLNAAMANIGSMGVAIPRVNELKKAIQDLSMQTGASTDDLAKGTYQIISAFGDNADTMKSLEINSKAAAAGVATLTDVVNMVSIVTKNWGDTSIEAQQHVDDLALKTVALGQTTMPALAQSLGAVAPQAHAAGLSQEELFAVMATGAGVIGTTSEVTTKLSSTLSAFEKPNKVMTALIKANGFASGDAMIATLGFEKSIMKVKQAADAGGHQLVDYLKRKEAVSLVTAFTTTLSKTYAENLKAEGDVLGETGMAYDAQANGVNKAGKAMSIMSATATVLMQKIGDGIGPALLKFAGFLQPISIGLIDLVDKFSAMSESTQTWIVGIAAGAAAIGPLLLGIGGLAKAIAFFLPMAVGLASALFTIGIPLGLLYGAYKLNLFGLGDLVDRGFKRVQAAAPLAGSALRGVWANLTGAKDDIAQTRAAVYDFVTTLTGSSEAGFTASTWVHDLGVRLESMRAAFSEAGGGLNGFVAAAGKLTGADVTINVKSQVTSVDWVSKIGNLSYTYDAKAGITSVDWKGLLGSTGDIVYDAKAGITKFDYNEKGFSYTYNAASGITSVDWKAADFTYVYNSKTQVTDINWNHGLFTGHYTATAGISSVAWGAWTHVYDTTSSITSVLWGYATHTYNASVGIAKDTIDWGAWTHVYDTTSSITSVLWGAYTHSYGLSGKMDSIAWGLWSHAYDTTGSVTSVLWGAFTFNYSATSGITSVNWGAFTYIYDVSAKVGDVIWGVFSKTYDVTANISSWVTSNMPSWLGGGGGQSIPSAGSFGHNAAGTDNWKGGWTWVGERGPELLNLPGSSKIISNANSRAMIGHMADGNYNGPWAPDSFVSSPLMPPPMAGGNYNGPWAPDSFISSPLMPPRQAVSSPPMTGGNYNGPWAPDSFSSSPLMPPPNPIVETHLKDMAKHAAAIVTHTAATATHTANTHRVLLATNVQTAQAMALRHARELAATAQMGIPANPANAPYAASFKAMQQAGIEIAKSFKGTVEEFKSFLQSVPGLFKSSPVTQKQMDMAKLGVPQNFADDYLRRLTDSVLNGKHWTGVDIKDAAKRAGIDPTLPQKAILEMFTEKWNNQSLFADKKNLSLINLDAVKAAIAQQQTEKLGAANIMEMFGITDAAVTAQGVAKGKKGRAAINAGLLDPLTGADAKGKKGGKGAGGVDILSGLSTDLTAQLAQDTTLGDVGANVLKKITGAWSDVSKLPDMITPLAGAIKLQLGSKDGAQTMFDSGVAIFQSIIKGYQDAASKGDFLGPVAAAISKNTASSATTTTPTVKIPAIKPSSNTGLSRDGVTHVWNVTANGPLDYEQLAYRVSAIQARRKG